MSRKKKTPEIVGGYSYKKIITKKNKNGTNLYYERIDGKLFRLKKDEKIKQENTKKYFKKKFLNDWNKEFKKAQTKFNKPKFRELEKELIKEKKQREKEYEKEKEQTKAEYLKSLGYPINETTLQASIITDTEINVIDGHEVYLIYNGERIKITKRNILEFRQMVEEMLSFYFEEFHASIKKNKKNKDITSLLQIPRSQISGGKYPIIYEIYLDSISITSGIGDEKENVSNEFYKKVKNKFNTIFKQYF